VERVTLEKKGVYDVALLQKVASLKNILDHTPEKQIRDQQITFFSFPFSQENGIQCHSLVTLFFGLPMSQLAEKLSRKMQL
jgi:hypothetical protein